MEPMDWKDFLLKYKWMPSDQLRQRFGIKRHDIDNFRRKPEVRAVLDPWRISLTQPLERLREILKSAWGYYFTQVEHIDFDTSRSLWVPKLLATKNVSKGDFSFLTNSKYLKIVCPEPLKNFRERGYTNIALAAYEFYPGSDVLRRNAVLPYMFQQTHSKALESTDAESMIEHVYLNFLTGFDAPLSLDQMKFAKEKMYVRYRETDFVTGTELSHFGVPANFYSKKGTLSSILESLHRKYGEELGYLEDVNPNWSSTTFKKQFPDRNTGSCEYCHLMPVDLHHLLPRKEHPHLTYVSDNVVPVCVNVHQRITRRLWTSDEEVAYNNAKREWLRAPKETSRQHLFKGAMDLIHSKAYSNSFLYGGQEQRFCKSDISG